jgi:outer membrane lipoprotein LolB
MLKRSFWKFLCTIVVTATLSACATKPAGTPALNKNLSWDERLHDNQCVTAWHLRGAIAINTPQESISGSLNWDQEGSNDYKITLVGPIGSGSMVIEEKEGLVSLETSDGHYATATTIEALMHKELKWALPVSNMFYWIRGIPSPHMPAETTFDAFHHLTALKQQSWDIDYLRYTGVDGTDLPSKIFINHGETHVRLIVNQWKIEKKCRA